MRDRSFKKVLILVVGLSLPGCYRAARPPAATETRAALTPQTVARIDKILKREWQIVGDRDKALEAGLFLSLLSTCYHHDLAGQGADWMRLEEDLTPVLLYLLEKEEPLSDRDYTLGLASKMAAAVEATQTLPALRRLVETEKGHARCHAIEAIGRLKDREMIPQLRSLVQVLPRPGELGGGQDYTTMTYAALALWRMGDDSGLPILRRYLEFPSMSIRSRLAMALAETGDESVVPILAESLDHRSVFPIPILETLGKFDAPRAVKALEERSKSEDLRVRQTAALELARQGRKNGLDVLHQDMRSGSGEVAFLAAIALSSLGREEAISPLANSLPDLPRSRQIVSGAALRLLGDPRGMEELKGQLSAPQWGYRAAAAALLSLYATDGSDSDPTQGSSESSQ